jgi:hypothetical protein
MGIPASREEQQAAVQHIECKMLDAESWGLTMPDIDRSPAQMLAKIGLPETAPTQKMARPMLDPKNPMTVTLVSPMQGTKNRVPRIA